MIKENIFSGKRGSQSNGQKKESRTILDDEKLASSPVFLSGTRLPLTCTSHHMSGEANIHRGHMPSIAVMFPPSASGIMGVIFLADIIKILTPLSKKIYVVVTFKPRANTQGNVHTIQMKGYRAEDTLLVKGVQFFLIQLKSCFHLLRISKHIDVVMFHIGSGLYLFPLVVARLLGKKTIFSEVGLYSQRASQLYQKDLFGLGSLILPPIFKILERITFCLTGRIIVESESVIDSSGLNRYRKKVSILPMRIINTDNLKIEKDLNERNLIGYIGRLSGEKGVMNLAKAICLILGSGHNLRFLIGGDGPLLKEIKHELKTGGAYGKTTLTGLIPCNEMVGYFNELRLFVLPSYTEGLPGTILEAMACGTPVLATPVGGIPDVIKDGETGFIMKNNSPECIAENIIRVLNHPNLEQVTKNARALVEREFTYEKAVEKYRNVI